MRPPECPATSAAPVVPTARSRATCGPSGPRSLLARVVVQQRLLLFGLQCIEFHLHLLGLRSRALGELREHLLQVRRLLAGEDAGIVIGQRAALGMALLACSLVD